MVIDELIAILGYDVKGEGELDRFNQGLDRAQHRAEVAAARINAVGVAAGAFFGTIAAQGAMRLGSLIGSLPGDILNVGKKFEAYGIQLKALEGSQEAANKALDWIGDFAKRTPLELDGVVAAYAQMRTFGLDPTNGSLQAMVDTMAMSGKGQEQLQGIILAVGQAWTAQKLQGQDAMQLMQRGVPVWDILSKAMGKSVEEVQKLSKAGKLGRKEIQLLIDEMGKRAAGASDEFAKSFDGITSNISDIWTGFLKQISDKGYYDNVKRRLSGVLETLNEWDKSGVLDKAATAISHFLSKSIDVGAHAGSQLWTIGKAAYYAANGIVELISRVTGLDKSVSAGILGAAVVGSTATGRAALLALAKRVPMIAALLALDDLMTTAKGGDSMITEWAGREKIDKINASLRDLLKNLSDWAEFKMPEDNSVVNAMEEQQNVAQKLADAFQLVIDGLNRLFGADRPEEVAQPTKPEIVGSGEKFDQNRLGPGQGGWIEEPKPQDLTVPMTDEALDLKFRLQEEEGRKAEGRAPTAKPAAAPTTVNAPTVETPTINPKIGPVDVKAHVETPTIRPMVETPTVRAKVEQPTIRLPDTIEVPPSRPQSVPAIKPDDATLSGEKLSSLADGILSAGEMMRSAIEKASSYVADGMAAYAADRAKKGDRVFPREPDPARFGPVDAPSASGMGQLRAMLENMNANLAKMTPEKAVQATVTDARQDNRQFPVTVNSTVNQTVTQASQAPAAAARATSQAVGQAAVPQAGRLAVDSAF